jgi:hypothetical protein
MLVVVPILAGIWKVVPLWLNGYADKIQQSATTLDATSARVTHQLALAEARLKEATVSIHAATGEDASLANLKDEVLGQVGIALAEVTKDTQSTQQNLQNIEKEILEDQIISSTLPFAFALIFFASLFAVTGHLIYQIFAPERIRRQSIHDFIRQRVEDYARAPSQEALFHAEEIMQGSGSESYSTFDRYRIYKHGRKMDTIFRKLGAETEPDENNRKIKICEELSSYLRFIDYGEQKRMLDYFESDPAKYLFYDTDNKENEVRIRWIKECLQKFIQAASREEQDKAQSRHEITVIERGARGEYLRNSRSNIIASITAILSYGASLYLIIIITWRQTNQVMDAAQIRSLLDIFS